MSTIVTLEGTLTPRAPFDFAKTLQFVGDFTPMEGEQTISDNVLTKAVMLNGRAVAFQVRNLGSVEEPQVAYTLFSARPLTEIEHEMLRDRIRFFLSLDDDLQPFYAVGRTDTHFAPVIQSLYGLHQPKFLTPFELACWAILTQRTPIAIAHRMKMALVARGGRSIILPEGVYRAFPEPQELAGMNIDELFSLVRNVRKSEYLYEVIRFSTRLTSNICALANITKLPRAFVRFEVSASGQPTLFSSVAWGASSVSHFLARSFSMQHPTFTSEK